ncbi:MAG: PilZ domain-containing protein [Proteobacteria bacterium]|nr:PilZ domain-containing protein [Pseudomonadota bacterium]
MTVVIGNTPYAIDNWSLDGMKIANYYGALQPPDHAVIKVLVPTAGPGALFQANAEIRRYDPSDVSLAIAFEGLDIRARATLNRYLQERVAHGQA